MPALAYYLICLAANVILLSLVFMVAKRMRRFDLVDAAWGWAFIVPAAVSYLLQPGIIFQWDVQTLVTAMVIIWGGRLSWHIIRRIIVTDHEDPRYVELRKKWRGNVLINIFFRVYMIQALLAVMVVLPVLHINVSADQTGLIWAIVGLVVWATGFICESLSDRQLRQFLADPSNRGKIMMTGLWKYSRHPNYFGELVQWWGIFIICLGVPFGWIGIIGPLLISYLILFVSGIPPNERRFMGRPGWQKYQKTTSILLPLPPKKLEKRI